MLAFKKWMALLSACVLATIGTSAQPNYPTGTTVPNLVTGEYYIDADPGFGNATPISITAGTDLAGINASIALSAVPVGVHNVGLRLRNANGIWGGTSFASFFKFDLPVYGTAGATSVMSGAEYFLNTDPGAGNGIPLVLPAQADASNQTVSLNISSLPVGFHNVGIRTRNALGQWSHTTVQTLAKLDVASYPAGSTAGNIEAAEYFIGTDPGLGNATALPIIPATQIANASFVLTVPSAPAIYTFGIRTRDAAGNWSHTSLRLYDNLTAATYPTAPPAPTALQRLEYFINDDPGLGNGTPISFTSSTNVADLNVSIDLTSVALGDHRLYIRSRNNPYSLTTIVPFTKGSALPVTWQYVRGEMRTDGAWLWWGTANETNTKHFVVEHSTDGSSFEALGTVVAAGNSNSSKQYQYVHTQPAAGLHYYRIKQVDKDGAFTYSAILLLQAQSLGADASIVPTVVASKFTLHLSKVYSQSLPYSIVSSAGAIIMQGKIAAGANQASIQVGHLPQGMYRLLLLAPEGRRTFNFLKQ